MASLTGPTHDPIYSTLANDPDLGELVDMFVEQEMPVRITAIRSAFERGDRAAVRRAAHQVTGAGGSYGFAQLTASAAVLEHSLSSEQTEETILRALGELLDLCSRVRSTKSGGSTPR